MPTVTGLLIAVIFFAVACFCVFGFMATHEPPGSPTLRAVYGLLGLACVAGAGWALMRKASALTPNWIAVSATAPWFVGVRVLSFEMSLMSKDTRAKRDLHALNEDGMVLCNPRDKEAADRAQMEGIATDDRVAVTCRKCRSLLYGKARDAGSR